MMKKYLLLLLVVSLSCEENKAIAAKNKTIDSLKGRLEDCTAQAKIMADILEKERIDQQSKHEEK